MPPSAHLSTLLAPFQSLFTAPTWRKVQRLIVGTILARGRRTVTAALRHTGQQDTPSFSLYHQVFNRARWSALKGSRRLLSVLVQTFEAAGGSLTCVIDETLERRWGRRIHKRGHYITRLLGFEPQAFRQHQWATLDRAAPGRHTALERPPLGLTCLERAGANAAGQRAPGAQTQDHRPVDAPDDPGGATLAAQRRHHRAGRSSLQRRGTRPCLPTLWSTPDCSPASRCGPP